MININAMKIGDIVMLPVYPRTEVNLRIGKVCIFIPKKDFLHWNMRRAAVKKLRKALSLEESTYPAEKEKKNRQI